jgi:peptidylprolyl isomerase
MAADAAKPAAVGAAPVAGTGDSVVAKMGTLEVQRSELERIVQGLQPAALQQLKGNRDLAEKMVRGRLAEKALVQQAQAQNWAQRPEVKAQIDAVSREIIFRSYLASVSAVPASYPSDQELTTAYDQTKAKMVAPAQYQVSQLFFPAPANNADAVARARKESADVAKQAQSPKADFEALTKKYQGGTTGFIPLEQLLPEMRPVVAKLQKGGVSAPIQSPQGFHILKLVDVHPQHTPTMAEVHDQLRAVMRQQRQQQAAEAYLEGLVNNQSVTIDGPALTSVLNNAGAAAK